MPRLAFEWDRFDFSHQPCDYKPYAVSGDGATPKFGDGPQAGAKIQGPEYLARVTTHAPDGTVSTGAAQVELFINGAYQPYGFK